MNDDLAPIGPNGVPRITVRPRGVGAPVDAPRGTPGGAPGADPWADLPDTPTPAPTMAPGGGAGGADPWASLPDTPPAPKVADKQISGGDATAAGVKNGLSFGAGPAMAGVAEASGEPNTLPLEEGEDPTRFFKGAAKMLHGWISGHPDPDVMSAYRRGREAALADQKLAQEQHPYAFLAGQLGGAIALPGLGIAGGATKLARVGRGAMAGTIGGGLYGAGEGVSEGQGAGDVTKSAGAGALTGAAFGTAGAAGAEVGAKVVNKAASIFRGARKDTAPDEAARVVVDALKKDHAAGATRMAPQEIAAANAAGTPRAIVDTGGERTRALFRSSANVSPEARQKAEEFVDKRYRNQSGRAAPYIRDLAGGMGAGNDVEVLKAAARAVNKPLYNKAYRAGDRPIWSPRLEQLAGSDELPKAMAAAVTRGRNRAALDGYGAFNPKVQVTQDGRLLFPKGANGTPAYPNLQFWDYTQRELRDAATKAERAGENEQATALKGLHRELVAELDKHVPEFKDARGVAAKFFGAADAHDAGAEFVARNVDFREAGRLLAKMSGPERELFARGFASRLADEIEKTGNRANVLDSIFLDSPMAKRKIEMALGPQRARQLEALLRAEALVDKARKALGNSTTARQWKELGMSAGHGVGGAGAVGALEAIKEHEFNPAHVIAAALTFGAVRHGAHIVDDRVARHVGELLVSGDASKLAKGLQIVTAKPVIFDALRHATAGASRVAAHDIGGQKALAGVGAVIQSGLHNPEAHNPAEAFADQAGQ